MKLIATEINLAYDLVMVDNKGFDDWLRPALPLLLLHLLIEQPAHGYGLVEQLRATGIEARGTTVYPHLSKLQDAGFITSHWQTPETGPARKVLTVTEAGRKQFQDLKHQWSDFRNVLADILAPNETDTDRSASHELSQ